MSRQLHLYTTDGALVRHIGDGQLHASNRSIAYTTSGDLVMCDSAGGRIMEFSGDGEKRLHTWGGEGRRDGLFLSPKAIAIAGPFLYVADLGRVQVFQ